MQLEHRLRRCSNYTFILDLTAGFKGFSKRSRKTVRESFKCGDLVRLIIKTWRLYDSKQLTWSIYKFKAKPELSSDREKDYFDLTLGCPWRRMFASSSQFAINRTIYIIHYDYIDWVRYYHCRDAHGETDQALWIPILIWIEDCKLRRIMKNKNKGPWIKCNDFTSRCDALANKRLISMIWPNRVFSGILSRYQCPVVSKCCWVGWYAMMSVMGEQCTLIRSGVAHMN